MISAHQKRCFIFLLTLLGLWGGLRAQEGRGARPFLFRPQHRPVQDVLEVVVPWFPDLEFRTDYRAGTLMTDVTPDRLESLQTVLDSIDVPKEPLDLTVHFLLGQDANIGGPFPDGPAAAEAIIRDRLPFRRYEGLNTVVLPSLELGHGKVSFTGDHVFEYWVDVVDMESQTADLRYSVSRTDPGRRESAALLEGSARIHEATPLVFGGVPFRPVNRGIEPRKALPETYLIVVVEAAIPAPFPPPQ